MLENYKRKLAKTDVSIEAMRCIAAFMVVMIHTMLPTIVNEQVMPFRTYVTCIIGDAVAIFWMIAGFFMFSEKKTYPAMIKRGIINIGLPTLILFLVTFYFYGFLVDGDSLSASIARPLSDYRAFEDSLLHWNAGSIQELAWYMFIYGLVLIFWPVLNAFVLRYLKGNNKNQVVFMAITFVLFAWNEIGDNLTFEFSHHALGGVVPASILIIWGWIIYQHKEIFKTKKRYGLIAIPVFFIVNFVRLHFQLSAVSQGDVSSLPIFWYTPFAMICASSIVIACISLVPSEPTTVLRRLIVVLGGTTLTVYLAHTTVNATLRAHLGTPLENALYPNGHAIFINQSATDCVYLFVNVSIIFFISVLVAFVFKALSSLLEIGYRAIADRRGPSDGKHVAQ